MNLLLSVLAASTVSAGLPEVSLAGDWSAAGGAGALAMGRLEWMDVSVLGTLSNPALGCEAGEGLGIGISGGLDLAVEKRTRTVYDEFGGSMGEAEHSFDRSAMPVAGGAGVTASGLGGLPEQLSLSAGIVPYSTFEYGYDRVLNNDYYVQVGSEAYEVSGSVARICLSAAFRVSDAVGFGIGGGLLTGSRETSWELDWVDPTLPDESDSTSSDLEGFDCRGSVLVRASERLILSAGAGKAVAMTWSGDVEGDMDMPPEFFAGAAWMPGNGLRTRVAAEAGFMAASGAELDGQDMGLRDCWTAAAGVRNTLPGGPDLMFGFRYEKSPVAGSLDAVSFTGGLGFEAGGWSFDAGASFTPRLWDQQDLDPLPSLPSGDSLAVEEGRTVLLVSATRSFSL
jgi:hypothetical protein